MKNVIVHKSDTLKLALKKIGKNTLGSCIIVENKDKLFGILSDGDIRRLIIKKIPLNSKVGNFCNRKVKSLSINSNNFEIQKNLNKKIKLIPLVNSTNKVIDYATIAKYRKIPISEPYFFGEEFYNVKECFDTNWISSRGKFVLKFEEAFFKFLKKKSLSVSSGTTGLELALKSLNLPKNSEVIMPVLTFASPANAIINSNLRPVFVDINKDDFTIDADQIEKKITKKTKVLLIVHLYGYPCNIKKIKKICNKHNLSLIEDCAEAIGSKIDGFKIGTFSDISIFSFFGNKTITTGEGGMVCFKSEKIYNRAKILRDHGMSPKKRYWHEKVGNNYRLTNLQAAIGCAQIKKLDKIVKKKIKIAKYFNKYFKKFKNIKFVPIKKNIINSYWLYPIYLENVKNFRERDFFLKKLLEKGIEGRNFFYPLSMMPIYKKFAKKDKFPVAKYVSEKGICLPTSYSLNLSDVKRISEAVSSLTT